MIDTLPSINNTMMSSQIAAAEEYSALINNPQKMQDNIEQLIRDLSKFIPLLQNVKKEELLWYSINVTECESKNLRVIYLLLSEQLRCYSNNWKSEYDLFIFLKTGESIPLPFRIH